MTTHPGAVEAENAVTDFEHEEHLSRQQAAERLVDIAYALTAGAPLELRLDGEQVRVPVTDEVHLMRRSTSKGDRVEVKVELKWCA
jgi:amphi-Trp domain-containing protein